MSYAIIAITLTSWIVHISFDCDKEYVGLLRCYGKCHHRSLPPTMINDSVHGDKDIDLMLKCNIFNTYPPSLHRS